MENSIIIVLGNFMDKFDRLNEESCSRLNLAIEKFNNNQYSFIVTSGWDYHGKYDTAMAVAMKSYIVKNSDISYELVLTEENSRDTVGDAIFTKKNVIKKKGLYNLLIVTSDYHVNRVNKIFSFIYGESYKIKVIGSKTPIKEEFSDQEDKSLSIFYKTFEGIKSGDDILIFKRLCSDHPFYNGDIYPKI